MNGTAVRQGVSTRLGLTAPLSSASILHGFANGRVAERLTVELDGLHVRMLDEWTSPATLWIYVSSPPAWLDDVVEQITELSALPPNWDTYGAPPLRMRQLLAVLGFLADSIPPEMPAPRLVPSSRGDIDAVWDSGGRRLEIDVHSAEKSVYGMDDITGETWSGPLRANLQRVHEWLLNMSSTTNEPAP